MKKMLLVIGLAVMLACTAGTAGASISATDGTSTAVFDIVGGNLQISLTNGNTACTVPTDVLTALFFSITGDPNLTLNSAIAEQLITMTNNPATVHNGASNANITTRWEYLSGLSVPQFPGANQGLGGAGLGVFGGPLIDGLGYGIAGGVATGGNGKYNGDFVNNGPLVVDTIVFTLGNLPGGFTLADIGHVGFQYGTSLKEAPPKVPEPGALLLLGSGLVGLALYRRRKA